ncbi:MAG TPA: NAD-dependent epimerase/dehydratase family protein [Thermoleophilaceae bacterium]|nr:NAD-dependent epimerase/dehydratase family protein [Thermoleophilaceae bacterium]
MRVVVFGASGNVGTSVLRSLADEPAVDEVVGVCRRLPSLDAPKVEWRKADISSSPLRPLLKGADAVVHLAWLIQPARDRATVRATNVDGTARLLRAVAAAGVPSLVYASSVGAYSPGPKDRRVDESWPTGGIPTSFYSRHKAEVERLLDRFEAEQPATRVVRLRPGLIFKREAASGIRRLFAGPLLPGSLLRKGLIPVVPATERLVFQALHSYDVGEAYRLALVSDLDGAFNLAADPVLDPEQRASFFGARRLPLPQALLRGGAAATYKLRLQPSESGWVDLALGVPLLDTSRARSELGWQPEHTSTEALDDLLQGMREGAGLDTPPLEPGNAGPARVREFLSGVGARVG